MSTTLASLVSRAQFAVRPRKRSTSKRLDIQGLRAVAVLLVVINHMTNKPVGGFVGVDVFFVISGFLITGLLIRDLADGEGRSTPLGAYAWGFYRRRIRRILPAALVVTGVTVVVARLTFNAARFATAWHDGLWATVFWANWHFAQAGTNYFAADAAPSPFQHYWSLSVEEQFYVVWPVLLFLAAMLFGRGGSIARRRAGAYAAAALCVLSLVVAAALSSSDPSSAYFSTFTRAWELGLGALLACMLPYLRGPQRLATTMSWVGVGLIAVSAFMVHGGSGFPFPGAVLPCVGTALALGAVSPEGGARNVLLTNPVSVWIGDLSYSIYLVHFPVLVILATQIAVHGTYYYATAIALTLGLAVGLYEYVEQPVLQSAWLMPSRDGRWTGRRRFWQDARPNMGLASIASVTAAMVVLTMWSSHEAVALAHQEGLIQNSIHSVQRHHKSQGTPQLARLQAANRAALSAGSWPTLHPSMDQILAGPAMPPDIEACSGTSLGPAASCTFGNPGAKHTIEIVGDSNGVAWVQAFRTMVAHDPSWNVRSAAGFACQFASTVVVQHAGAYTSHCAARNAAVVSDIRARRPDVLVVTNLDTWTYNETTVEQEINKVRSSVGKVVILGAPPQTKDPSLCYTPRSTPQDCVSQLQPANAFSVSDNQVVASVVHGIFVDVTQWFVVGGYIPPFSGGVPTRYDASHMSSAFATRLAPVLREALTRARAMAS